MRRRSITRCSYDLNCLDQSIFKFYQNVSDVVLAFHSCFHRKDQNLQHESFNRFVVTNKWIWMIQ